MYKTTRSRVFVVLDTNRLWLWMSIKCFWLTLWSRRFERSAAPNATLLRPRDHHRTDLAEMIRERYQGIIDDLTRDTRGIEHDILFFFLKALIDDELINEINYAYLIRRNLAKFARKRKKLNTVFLYHFLKYMFYMLYI